MREEFILKESGVHMIDLRVMTPNEFESYFHDKLERYKEVLAENVHEVGEAPSVHAENQLNNLLPEGLTTPHHHLYTVQVEGQLAGYVWVKMEVEKKSAFLYEIYLLDTYRGQGIGTEVMKQLETLIQEKEITYFKLHVFGSNTAARKLYEELGFHVAGVNMMKKLSGRHEE